MIIGFNAFNEDNSLVFDDRLCHTSYNRLEITNGVFDHIYIDEDIEIPYTIEKPFGWRYSTSLLARFQNSLEAGSVEAEDVQIEKIRFQKRRWDELVWQDVAEIEYTPDERLLYEAIDKYIANDFVYQYSIIPMTSTILGNRIPSKEITAKFDGIFISDKDANYKLIYDAELSDIKSVTANTIFEPKSAKYPIVVYGNLDYDSFEVTATFLSTESIQKGDGTANIRMERLGKDRLLKFMKNNKPKIYRDHHGNLKLVSVVGNPREIPYNNIGGVAKLSFSLVEIGDTDSETLKANNLLVGLEEVF